MNLSDLRLILAYLCMAGLAAVIGMYAVLITIAIAWGIKNTFRSIFGKKQPKAKRLRFKELFQRNLLINDLFGVLVVFGGFLIVSLLPSQEARRQAMPFVAALIPYGLGFYRSAGIGIHCGVIGAIAGFIFIEGFPVYQVSNLEQIALFLVIILISNISGWLGAYLGQGQIKDSKTVMIFNVQVSDQEHALDDLMCTIRQKIDQLTGQDYKLSSQPPVVSIAQVGPVPTKRSAILKYAQQYQWRRSYAPIALLVKSLFSHDCYSGNEVLDYVSNLMRHMVIDLVVRSDSNKTGGCGNFHVAVMVYKETPAITWFDGDVEKIAEAAYREVEKTIDPPVEAQTGPLPWTLVSQGVFVTRYWQKPTRLEQYFKNTLASKETGYYASQLSLTDSVDCGAATLQEFSDIPTLFDRIRGNAMVFALFFGGQIGIGIFVNWMYDLLKQ